MRPCLNNVVQDRSRTTGDKIWVYRFPNDPWLVSSSIEGPAIIDMLDSLRKAAIGEHEALRLAQKNAGQSGDRDMARWLREPTSAAMKRLRAIRLWAGHFGSASNDCPWIDRWNWPVDLADDLDQIAREIILWASA